LPPDDKPRFESINQFVRHLLDDVLPVIADRVTAE
jgi:hypothetical protein